VTFVQILQFLLPAGEVFNPIKSGLLNAMNVFESPQLTKISLYKQTTGLVNYMRDTANYSGSIYITGQSLGGGIALITVSTMDHFLFSAFGKSGPFSHANRCTSATLTPSRRAPKQIYQRLPYPVSRILGIELTACFRYQSKVLNICAPYARRAQQPFF
jgi:hypothetical protein